MKLKNTKGHRIWMNKIFKAKGIWIQRNNVLSSYLPVSLSKKSVKTKVKVLF